MKYILVSGGTVSTLGKGIAASSIALLLQQSGLNVTSMKIDPYLNIDAGLHNPQEHGETFVLGCGAELDLDLGNYERFLNIELTRHHNITTGRLFQSVLDKERRGDYLGKTCQLIPHVTDEATRMIEYASQLPVDGNKQPEVVVIELGGCISDLESQIYLETFRQLKYRVGNDSFCHVHVNMVVEVADGEQKSKPTQTCVKQLMSAGLPPDYIFCRSKKPVQPDVAKKIAFFAMIPENAVISVHDVSDILKVPQLLLSQRVPSLILSTLRIMNRAAVESIPRWSFLTQRIDTLNQQQFEDKDIIKIALVGKYTVLKDSYLSVQKSVVYTGLHLNKKIEILWIESSHLEDETRLSDYEKFKSAWVDLKRANGILVPGGFGTRGTEGMLLALHYARIQKIPTLAICLGFQLMVIEFARSILGIETATSAEFDPSTSTPIIKFMPDVDSNKMGGTMRLGKHTTLIASGSLAHYIYGKRCIEERHRHRYEVNQVYIDELTAKGARFSGVNTTRDRMEIFELNPDVNPDLPSHPFYFGVQFHPEFHTRVMSPSPCFVAFILAAGGMFCQPNNKNDNTNAATTHSQQLLLSRSTLLPPFEITPTINNNNINNSNLITTTAGGVGVDATTTTPIFTWDNSTNGIDHTSDIDLIEIENRRKYALSNNASNSSQNTTNVSQQRVMHDKPPKFFVPDF